jgi:hypothetical protein
MRHGAVTGARFIDRAGSRRAKGRGMILLLALFNLAPVFPMGDGHTPEPHPPPRHRMVGDTVPYWLFFSEDSWVGARSAISSSSLPISVRERSRWLRAVSVDVPADQVHRLRDLPGVLEIQPVRRLVRVGSLGSDARGFRPLRADPSVPQVADTVYGQLGPILQRLEVPAVHQLGFSGTGTRIGILAGHFLPGHAVIGGASPVAVRDFVEGDDRVEPGPEDSPESADHGTGLWSLISGDMPGRLTGVAPGAGILLARVLSDRDPVGADEDRWVAGLEWLESHGARVVLSGTGFRNFEGGDYTAGDLNGDVAPATLAADEAARRGILVVAPVGNEGPGAETLASPSDGDSVLAVGSVNLTGSPSSFSSRGPTSDGRPKPDLMAPGEAVPVASGTGDDSLGEAQGTEFAGALLAGAAALLVEAHPERGPMEILQALALSAPVFGEPTGLVPRIAPAVVFPDGVSAIPLQEVNAQGQLASLAPQVRWDTPTLHPLGLPVTFHLEFAEDSTLQQPLLTDSVVGTFARRLQEPLPPRTRLFWRVEARSSQGIRRPSQIEGPVDVPPWVSLDVLNDPSGIEVADPQPEFKWTAVELLGPAGPFTFELQVLLDREGEVIQSYSGLQEERVTLDEPLPFNVPLRWSVIAEARTGAVDTVTSAGPFVVTGGENPPVTILYQNFPNPFPNLAEGIVDTRIWFDLAEHSRVRLAVFDMRGRLVRNLIPGRGCGPVELPPGLYGREEGVPQDPCTSFSWDGRDDGGQRVSSGVYLLRLQAGGVVEVRRVVFWP